MKSYNRIELKGNIGQDARVQTVGERNVANFSVATEWVTKGRDGNFVSETTWLSVCAWEGTGICDLSLLTKGTRVSVTGRMRQRTYLDRQENEREILEVVADTVDVIYEPAKNTEKTPKTAQYSDPKPYGNKSYNQNSGQPF